MARDWYTNTEADAADFDRAHDDFFDVDRPTLADLDESPRARW